MVHSSVIDWILIVFVFAKFDDSLSLMLLLVPTVLEANLHLMVHFFKFITSVRLMI